MFLGEDRKKGEEEKKEEKGPRHKRVHYVWPLWYQYLRLHIHTSRVIDDFSRTNSGSYWKVGGDGEMGHFVPSCPILIVSQSAFLISVEGIQVMGNGLMQHILVFSFIHVCVLEKRNCRACFFTYTWCIHEWGVSRCETGMHVPLSHLLGSFEGDSGKPYPTPASASTCGQTFPHTQH